MLRYILKRFLIFIPTMVVISLITFVISINAPGDPVENMLTRNAGGESQSSQKLATEKAYDDLRKQLGLHLPVFYFSITNSTVSDTLYKISKIHHRENLERLSFRFGNWPDVSRYYNNLRQLDILMYDVNVNDDNASSVQQVREYVNTLFTTHEEPIIRDIFSRIDFEISETSALGDVLGPYTATRNAFETMVHGQAGFNKYIPQIHWYGLDNQYHRWLFGDKPWFKEAAPFSYSGEGVVRGDFGTSYQDKRPVASVIGDAMKWTLILSIFSIIIAYIIAIPLGVLSAVKKGTGTEKVITTGLFMMYSLPSFWIATILILFFGGGDFLDWFPAFGVGSLPESAPFWDRFWETTWHFVLPLFCLTYASFAFISRQMRGGMLNVLGQDYVRTAKAKGLSNRTVIWKHAFRNSLLPIITLFANIFPAVVSGSFVIEYIFSVPGMGYISYNALMARNYPVVFTVLLLTGFLTLLGYLVSDILYASVDPRISYTKKRS